MIGIETFQGRLRLRLPRSVTSKRYITLGLDDTPENRKKAQLKAWEIEADLSSFEPRRASYFVHCASLASTFCICFLLGSA